jgi:hypothetical protein
MRFRLWIVTLCALVGVSGCVASTGDFCDIARPMYFASDASVDWIADNDERLLRDIVSHNEKTKSCGAVS